MKIAKIMFELLMEQAKLAIELRDSENLQFHNEFSNPPRKLFPKPRVDSFKTQYPKTRDQGSEIRHDQNWPYHQPRGDNRQSRLLFAHGRDKKALQRAFAEMAFFKPTAVTSEIITAYDRLVAQMHDEGDDDYEFKTKAAKLYNDANGKLSGYGSYSKTYADAPPRLPCSKKMFCTTI